MCFFGSVATRMSNVLRRRRRESRAASSPTLLVALFMFLVGPHLEAVADTLDEFQKRQFYDFEQCANACQIRFDQSLFLCGEYRKPADGVQSADCRPKLDEDFKSCLQACPADPRPDQN